MPPPSPSVIFCGEFDWERLPHEDLCAPFGWQVLTVPRPESLKGLAVEPALLAGIFLDLCADPSLEVEIVGQTHSLLPEVPLVACVRFSDSLDWDVLREAGAYSCLHRPLAEIEVRQTLGFLCEHYRNRLAAHRPPSPAPSHAEGAESRPSPLRRRHRQRSATG